MQRFISRTPKCEILVADKKLVDGLLEMNVGNRRIREKWSDYFKAQAHKGDLILTNQGIGVSCDGVLIDGQHRLMGIAAAGYPAVQLLVVYGLPVAAKAVIDIGVNRSVSDILHFAFGRPEVTSSMVAATRAWGVHVLKFTGLNKIPPTQIFEWYMEIGDSLRAIFEIPQASKLSGPVLAVVTHRIHRHPSDQPAVMLFLEKLISGVDLSNNSPILRLREWMKDNPSANRATQQARFDRTVSALIAHLQGMSLSKLYIREDAAELLGK